MKDNKIQILKSKFRIDIGFMWSGFVYLIPTISISHSKAMAESTYYKHFFEFDLFIFNMNFYICVWLLKNTKRYIKK